MRCISPDTTSPSCSTTKGGDGAVCWIGKRPVYNVDGGAKLGDGRRGMGKECSRTVNVMQVAVGGWIESDDWDWDYRRNSDSPYPNFKRTKEKTLKFGTSEAYFYRIFDLWILSNQKQPVSELVRKVHGLGVVEFPPQIDGTESGPVDVIPQFVTMDVMRPYNGW